MPTAILRFYTAEDGFLVAADSLGRDRELGTSSGANQKIFLVNEPSRALVYGLMGTAKINDPTDSFVALDLLEECEKSAAALAQKDPVDLLVYAKKFCRPLHRALENQKNSKKISAYPVIPDPNQPDRSLIVTILFWGYFKGVAVRTAVKITHRNQSLDPLDVSGTRLEAFPEIYGSLIISKALFREIPDPRLASYWVPAMSKPLATVTIAESKEISINYVRACESDAGREMDPELAPGIGGDVQIAAITPQTGAQWIDGHFPPTLGD